MTDIDFEKYPINTRRGGGRISSVNRNNMNCNEQGFYNGTWRFWGKHSSSSSYKPMCPEDQRTTRYPCHDFQCGGPGYTESYCCAQYPWGPECCEFDKDHCCVHENCLNYNNEEIEGCYIGSRCRFCPPAIEDEPPIVEEPGKKR